MLFLILLKKTGILKKVLLYIAIFVYFVPAYGSENDTLRFAINTWRLSRYFHDNIPLNLDTSINRFHIYHHNYKNSASNSYLGNVGLPSKSNLFFDSTRKSPFLFQQSYDDYIFKKNNLIFYYTVRPLSIITSSSGGDEEQLLDVMHTQNVNEKLNFGINYRTISTDGYYLRQLVKHNSFRGWTSYISPYYSMHLAYMSNRNNVYHNGGIVDDSYVTDSINRADNIIVKLNDAKTEMYSRSFNIVQKIHINKTKKIKVNDTTFQTTHVPIISLGHHYNIGRYYKNYFDEITSYRNPVLSDTLILDYYLNTYNFANTFDTSYYKEYKNEFFLNFHDNDERKIKPGAHILVGIKHRNYYYFNKDTLFDYSKDTLINDYYYGIGLYNYVGKKWNWDIKGIVTFKGYSEGDLTICGFAKRTFYGKNSTSFISLSGSYVKETNDYFLNSYYSNHFRWLNNFLPPERTKIYLTYDNPGWKFEVGGSIAFLDNFIYFDTLALPNQETNTFDIYSAFIKKNFKIWKFHLDNHLVYQKVENDSVLRLPEYIYYGSLYIEDMLWNWKWMPEEFNNVLHIQLGIDVYYHSGYFGYSYMPAIEQFYLQNEKLIGNYPIISAFANLKLKNVRIFVKYEHINTGLIDKNPFTTLHYPLSESMLKFGLSWGFYN